MEQKMPLDENLVAREAGFRQIDMMRPLEDGGLQQLHQELGDLVRTVIEQLMQDQGPSIEEVWNQFQRGLREASDKATPLMAPHLGGGNPPPGITPKEDRPIHELESPRNIYVPPDLQRNELAGWFVKHFAWVIKASKP